MLDLIKEHSQKIIEMLFAYTPKFILALLVLVIGFWLINRLTRLLAMALETRAVDVTLKRFLESLLGILLKALLVISAASMIGIATTSFIAVLGAAGLAIGLALQGSLANFAGGVILLLFRPYKVGDYIETQGHSGTVNSIQIFSTVLKTADNKTIIIPNGPISNGSIVNYSTESTRRVDMVFGAGYDDDVDTVMQTLTQLIKNDERILAVPDAQVLLGELADSSINFKVRMWVNSADYWGVFFDMQKAVKQSFDAQGISIPFPQRDVHVYAEKQAT